MTASSQNLSFVLLAIAAALSYAAVRTMVRVAVVGPATLAWAGWLPVAATTIVAAARGRWELAVAVVFSSSVLSLVLLPGVTLIAAAGPTSKSSPRLRLILPLTLAVVLCGFKGVITIYHAPVLLALYAVSAWLWAKGGTRGGRVPDARAGRGAALGAAYGVIGVVLAGLGGWYANEAVRVFEQSAGLEIDGPAAALMLAPAALLAMIGISSDAGRAGRSEEATAAAVGIALANIGLLLPGLALAWAWSTWSHAGYGGPEMQVRQAILSGASALPFAVGKWRLDSVVLVLAAIFFLPAALGRLKAGRAEGFALLIAYLIYVAVAASAALAQ